MRWIITLVEIGLAIFFIILMLNLTFRILGYYQQMTASLVETMDELEKMTKVRTKAPLEVKE